MSQTDDPLFTWHAITSRATPGRPQREAMAINHRIRDAAQAMLTPWDRIDDFRAVLTANADASSRVDGSSRTGDRDDL